MTYFDDRLLGAAPLSPPCSVDGPDVLRVLHRPVRQRLAYPTPSHQRPRPSQRAAFKRRSPARSRHEILPHPPPNAAERLQFRLRLGGSPPILPSCWKLLWRVPVTLRAP